MSYHNNDKSPHGTARVTTGGTATLATANTWYDWAGTFAGENLEDFTHSGGVLTLTGRGGTYAAQMSGWVYAANAGWYEAGVSKNGGDPAAGAYRQYRLVGGASASGITIAVAAIVQLTPGDTVRVQFRCPGAAARDQSTKVECCLQVHRIGG